MNNYLCNVKLKSVYYEIENTSCSEHVNHGYSVTMSGTLCHQSAEDIICYQTYQHMEAIKFISMVRYRCSGLSDNPKIPQ